MCSLFHGRFAAVLLLAVLGLAAACRTARPFPVVDATQPGWQTQRFPALWRPPGGNAPEIAGDLWLTRHEDGRTLVHFTKTPMPTLMAWRAPDEWQIECQPRTHRAYGHGTPPARYLLLWVPEALAGRPLPAGVMVENTVGESGALRLRHRHSGETFTLFRTP